MNLSSLKTINDLLEWDSHPISFVQGHHTRIVKDSSGGFYVYRQEGTLSTYNILLYSGSTEELAVKTYVESEIQE